jgi:hypothetical protein
VIDPWNDLTGAGTSLDRLAATSAASVHLALDLCVGANILESCSIAVVGVDAGEFATVNGGNALDVDVTLALRGAVSARPVCVNLMLNSKGESFTYLYSFP